MAAGKFVEEELKAGVVKHEWCSSKCGKNWISKFQNSKALVCSFWGCTTKENLDGAHVRRGNQHFVVPLCSPEHHNKGLNGDQAKIKGTQALRVTDRDCIHIMEYCQKVKDAKAKKTKDAKKYGFFVLFSVIKFMLF